MAEVIRRATMDDFDRIFHLARAAFPIQASDREEILRTFRPERNLVLEEDGVILARALGHPMAHWFGGKRIPSIGIAGVTVSPEARGRGYGTRIVHRLLDDATADAATPLSALYPATLPIYRTLGYGDAFHRNGFKATLSALPKPSDPTVTVREMTDSDLSTILGTYESFAATRNGLLSRDAAWWGERILTDHHPYRFLAFRDETCVGWIIYGFERTKEDWRQNLVARDLVWLDIGAARALLGIAALHRSTCKELTWVGPLDEPMHGAQHDHALEFQYTFRAMLRLLDVPEALRARGYPPLTDTEVTLAVVDPHRKTNEGPWRITVAKGSATVAPAETQASARVSVQALASMYSGLMLARDAVRTGGLEADPDTVTALEAMFAGPSPYLPDFF